MTVFSTIILLFVLLTIIYVVSFVISLFKKKADTYYICEDGSFRQFGRVEYNVASDSRWRTGSKVIPVLRIPWPGYI